MARLVSSLLASSVFAFASMASAQSAPTLIESEALLAKRTAKVYIVQTKGEPVLGFTGDSSGMQATKPAPGEKVDSRASHVRAYRDHLKGKHDQLIGDVGGKIVYHYVNAFNGVAANLTDPQVAKLRASAEVVSIWKDEVRQIETDTTPNFLGLNGRKGPWRQGLTGEDVIIGVIDTGVWPEHPSFADVKTPLFGDRGPKRPYGPAPDHWAGDTCDFGNTAFNPLDEPFDCNNKLLGARFFVDGFTAAGLVPGEFLSARDNDGHGSHTGSTAGGNAKVKAEIGDEKFGRVSGMAPRARIAVYKVCWNGSNPPPGFGAGCASSDSMAAIDQAVADGVDVINFSIGGASTSFSGPDDIAFLFAADAGVFVATSQGNSGPDAGTTGTPAGVPWVTSVGALADNEVFNAGVEVSSSDASANGLFEGVEAAIGQDLGDLGMISGTLVLADDGLAPAVDGCEPLVNGADIAGNIAMIQRGGCAFSTKFLNAQDAGAIGLVVFNNAGDPITMGGDGTGITIPGVMVSQGDGDIVANALAAGDTASAVLAADAFSKEDTTAVFSSRGPNGGAPDIIKPDIAAPGVNILAAHTPIPNDGAVGGELFQIISGTSMSSPHVAGIGALVKQAHPDWTPAMIRSAMMTTANPFLFKSFGEVWADPFDVGAGKVRANRAFNPGLVYDADLIDYVQFLCGSTTQGQIFSTATCDALGSIDSSDLNLPSIGVSELVGSQTVTRTVTNVATKPGRHHFFGDKVLFRGAVVHMPDGVNATISPRYLHLSPGESGEYTVTFDVEEGANFNQFSFGRLAWHGIVAGDGRHDFLDIVNVSSPIAVRPVQIDLPASHSETSAPLDGVGSFDVGVGFEGNLNVTSGGLDLAEIQEDMVATGDATLHFFVVPPGTRVAKFSLFDESVGDGSGLDDLDLQIQGPDTAGFPLVDFSGSPTSNEDVTMIDPEPGVYAAFVIHFASVNPDTEYDLHFWDAGANQGNFTVVGGGPVGLGSTETIDLNWSGLAPGSKYRGFASFADDSSDIGITVVEVDTAP